MRESVLPENAVVSVSEIVTSFWIGFSYRGPDCCWSGVLDVQYIRASLRTTIFLEYACNERRFGDFDGGDLRACRGPLIVGITDWLAILI